MATAFTDRRIDTLWKKITIKCYTLAMKQGQKTKLFILEESNKLFYTNGYSNTSFTDIMQATGLSKGNITYHFKSKQIILEGIVSNRLQQIENSFKKWESQSQNAEERLILFCEMIIGEQENIKSFGCPMGTLTAEFSKNNPILYDRVLPMFELYRRWLAHQYTLLDYDMKEADEKGMTLLARVQGIAMVSHAFKDKSFLVSEMKKIILNQF